MILPDSVFPRHFQVFALTFGSCALKFSGPVTTFCLLLVNTCVRFVALIIMAEVAGRSEVQEICFCIPYDHKGKRMTKPLYLSLEALVVLSYEEFKFNIVQNVPYLVKKFDVLSFDSKHEIYKN